MSANTTCPMCGSPVGPATLQNVSTKSGAKFSRSSVIARTIGGTLVLIIAIILAVAIWVGGEDDQVRFNFGPMAAGIVALLVGLAPGAALLYPVFGLVRHKGEVKRVPVFACPKCHYTWHEDVDHYAKA